MELNKFNTVAASPEEPVGRGERTRQLVVQTALRLFRERGYDRTTIKQIGAGAGLNPALIYYYFAGKEGLYKAVLQRLFDALLSQGGALLAGSVPPTEAFRRLLALQAEWLLARPNFYRLLVREMVDHDARHAQEVMLQMAAGPFQRLCRVIEEGQRSGTFRIDIEPRFAALSTAARLLRSAVLAHAEHQRQADRRCVHGQVSDAAP